MEERIPLLRLFDNRNRARPSSPIPLHNILAGNRPGSDPTPQSIDSSPRSLPREDGAGRDEALPRFRQATSIEVETQKYIYFSTS